MEIRVNGMVCTGCENRIKNALSTIDGVESVEASHEKGIVLVKTNKEIKREIIVDKIDDLGFEVIEEN